MKNYSRNPLVRVSFIVGLAALLGCPSVFGAPASQSLFNGVDLTGWKAPEPNPWWRAKGGVLVGESDEALKGSMLWTEKSYGDFIFECEARWQGEIDSGVMMRKPPLQVQIGISRSLKVDMTGSFYVSKIGYPEAGKAKAAQSHFKVGDWVRLRIEARGPVFKVFLNGDEVVTYTDAKYAEPGPIGLQIHPKLKMKVEFRNLRVTELR